jgi:uncharacterized protein YndB with AHSA1/START domain
MDAKSASISAGQDFVITRVFNAPREMVWRAWTEREQLVRWFGPKGSTMPHATLDLRPGGTFHYAMRGPDGREIWGKWTFREIVAPERLVMVTCFSDAQGGIAPAPMIDNWPLETLSTTTFEEHDGKTTVTLRWSPLNATASQCQTFARMHDSMRQGWGGTFEQLDTYLGKANSK